MIGRLKQGWRACRHQRHQLRAAAASCAGTLLLTRQCLVHLQGGTDMDVLVMDAPSDDDCDDFDLTLSDVRPEDLHGEFSDDLKVKYLAAMDVQPSPVCGQVVYTHRSRLRNMRAFVTLPVAANGKSVAVHFLVDTGAPRTYIAQSVLDALGVPEECMAPRGRERLEVNGIFCYPKVSDSVTAVHAEDSGPVERKCHFAGLNLLGMDFLNSARVQMSFDMRTSTVSLASKLFP